MKRKNHILVLAALILTLCFSGCGKKEDVAETIGTAEAAETAEITETAEAAEITGAAETAEAAEITGVAETAGMSVALHRNINTTIRYVGPEGNVAVSDQGLYYTESTVRGDACIWYYDFAAGEASVVCSIESCAHEDASCEGIYLPDAADPCPTRVSPLGVYEDKLYVLQSGLTDSVVQLYRSGLDGQDRELLWEGRYASPDPGIELRTILADSVIWDGSRVYVEYTAEDHFVSLAERWEEETGEMRRVSVDNMGNLETGILYIDVEENPQPVMICEEGCQYRFVENEDGFTELQAMDTGYLSMMAVRDGSLYYRSFHTDGAVDWEEYLADPLSYKAAWNAAFTGQITEVRIDRDGMTENVLIDLGTGVSDRSSCYEDKIYYSQSDRILEYDLSTGQTGDLMAAEGMDLEDVINGWVILRDYREERMLLFNLETGETVEKEAALGDNLYGSVRIAGQPYWFMRFTEGTSGGRLYQWYLVGMDSYLYDEEPAWKLVTELYAQY